MNIKPIRKAKHLTQQQLADRLNICRTTLTMWETGKAKPSVDRLVAMADILGCTTDELIGRTAPQSCNSEGPTRVELRFDAETYSRVICKAIHDSLEAFISSFSGSELASLSQRKEDGHHGQHQDDETGRFWA